MNPVITSKFLNFILNFISNNVFGVFVVVVFIEKRYKIVVYLKLSH